MKCIENNINKLLKKSDGRFTDETVKIQQYSINKINWNLSKILIL